LALSNKKNALKRQRFADVPDIQHNVTLLRRIPENNFQDGSGNGSIVS
jgi:hypothetical protein